MGFSDVLEHFPSWHFGELCAKAELGQSFGTQRSRVTRRLLMLALEIAITCQNIKAQSYLHLGDCHLREPR